MNLEELNTSVKGSLLSHSFVAETSPKHNGCANTEIQARGKTIMAPITSLERQTWVIGSSQSVLGDSLLKEDEQDDEFFR